MKFKKILSGVLASALLVSAMPAFSAFAVDTDETGNSILDAVDVKYGEIISGDLSSNDYDWYKISLPSAGKINITLASVANFNGRFHLYSGNDEATALESNVGLGGTKVFTYYLTAGDYYICIREPFGVKDSSYDMQVKFTPSDVTFDSVDNNTIAKAAAVEYDGTVYNGQISFNDSVDYYTFDAAEKGRITLNFDSPMNNVDWEIYDSEKSKIKNGSFSKGEQDSGISDKEVNIMKEGKYTIAFKKNDSYGDYSFSLDYLKNYNDLSISGIIASADINEDGDITPADASYLLSYYAYLSTGGTEKDINKWLAKTK